MGKDGLHRHGWRNCPETVRSSTCTPSPRHALRRAHGAVLCLVRSCDHRREIGGFGLRRARGYSSPPPPPPARHRPRLPGAFAKTPRRTFSFPPPPPLFPPAPTPPP